MRRDSVPREVVAATLEKIRLAHGGKLRPRDTVDDARAEQSEIHPIFTWDDEIAGDNWRLQEARDLIRSVQVEFNGRKVRQYYSVPVVPREESHYLPHQVLVEQPDEFESAFDQLLKLSKAVLRDLEDLKHIAMSSPDHGDRLAMIALAQEAFSAAAAAVQRIM